MRRRELLAGAAGLGVLGVGAAVAGGYVPFSEPGAQIPEHELEGIDAPGSEAGPITVPERGRVTFVEVFATWCGTCQQSMAPLGEAYDTVGSDVQFVSITYEHLGRTTTREDVAEWWREHDGHWPVVYDEDAALSTALDATGVPHAVVLDEDNAITWSDTGYKPAAELLEAIQDATGESG